MINIKPFKGTRPYIEQPQNITAPSTDYLSEQGIIDFHEKYDWNYLKVLNPIGLLKEEDSFKIAREQFLKMKFNNIIKQDLNKCFYIYQISTNNHSQTGFLAITSINDFIKNKIKGHELTYESRIQKRANQMRNINSQVGPIYVSYYDNFDLDNYLSLITNTKPQYDFKSFDSSQHTLWCVSDEKKVNKIKLLSKKINNFYIADGHHRMEALSKLFQENLSKNLNHLGSEKYNHFMIAAFPKSQSKIYDYNRVVKDLNGLSVELFLDKIRNNFECNLSSNPVKPKKIREFGMYHDNEWYCLNFKKEELLKNNILSKLDINIIDDFCLKPILGIEDANKDDRIRFISGSHGLETLKHKVDENANSVAFSIFPTQIDDVIEVANKNLTMPPKSTWFDPKPLDGLVVYEFDQ